MSVGFCSYCSAQTEWETDANTGATYCSQCYMQPQVEHTTPQCVNCGTRAGFYEDSHHARYCNYCRQMMATPDAQKGIPHDPRYENDPLEGLHCPFCGRGDAIYNTTEGGGYMQTMCRRCRRPVPNASSEARSDVRAHVNPDLFRVYDEFDPVQMRQRFENVQPPPQSTIPPHMGQIPTTQPQQPQQQQQQQQAPPTSACSNCHTAAYLVQNPNTGFLQCKRCGQWVSRAPAPPPPQPRAQPPAQGFAPTVRSDVCPVCGVRGVVMGGHGFVHCPQCRRALTSTAMKPTPSLKNIQTLFEPGSPEHVPQPNRIGQRDDDVFGF